MKRANLVGKQFGKLSVIKFSHIFNQRSYWECFCICGNIKIVSTSALNYGTTNSCGCVMKQIFGKTHGMSNTRIYKIWQGIIKRCTNPNDQAYINYGGRGIKVCDRWLTFEGFFKDNGDSYEQHIEEFGEKDTTADRYPNVNGNYEPNNFRWATRIEQACTQRHSTKTENYKEHKKQRNLLSSRLRKVVTIWRKTKCIPISYIFSYLGGTFDMFITHIESQFQPGMTWDNWGKGNGKWNFDHIIGCNNFDLSKEEERKSCFHYTNIRPMWYEDHIKKSIQRIEYAEAIQ